MERELLLEETPILGRMHGSMSTVALVQCPQWDLLSPPLALAHLAAYLRTRGIETACHDLNCDIYHRSDQKELWDPAREYFWLEGCGELAKGFYLHHRSYVRECLGAILARGSVDIVGVSLFKTSAHFSCLVAKEIKAMDPDVTVVFGGVSCYKHEMGRQLIACQDVDYVAYGEGEEAFLDLIRQIRRGDEVNCPGVLGKRDGGVIDFGERPPIPMLDSLPFADFSDFDLDRYATQACLPISTSRGCIRRCHFCTEWILSPKYRYRTAENIFAEIVAQRERYPTVAHFNFQDSLMNGNLHEFERFCDLVIARGLKITWSGQGVIHPGMTRELCRKASRAGCVWISYGLESASPRVLKLMRKGFLIEDAEEVIRRTHEAGIQTGVNFMFGYPGETEDDFQASLAFVTRNARSLDGVSPTPAFTAINEGSFLFAHAEQFGLAQPPHPIFWNDVEGTNTYPDRLRKFETFCEQLRALGVRSQYPDVTLPNRQEALADYFVHQGNLPVALSYYRSSIAKEGETVTKLRKLSHVCASMKEYDQALEAIRRAIRLAETDGGMSVWEREQVSRELAALEETFASAAAVSLTAPG